MAEFRSIKDLFRNPLVVALVLVVILVLLAGVGGSLLSFYKDQGSQEIRAKDQPSTQSLPADDKDQPNYQAPPITQPSTQAPATGETKTP